MPSNDLIIVERGADWAAWMVARRDRPTPTISVIQEHREAPESFALRVEERVAHLSRGRVSLRSVTLLSGHDGGLSSLSTRLSIIRQLRRLALCQNARIHLQPSDPPPHADAPAPTVAPHVPLEEHTRDELYNRARELAIDGRSKMRKAQLVCAIRRAS